MRQMAGVPWVVIEVEGWVEGVAVCAGLVVCIVELELAYASIPARLSSGRAHFFALGLSIYRRTC